MHSVWSLRSTGQKRLWDPHILTGPQWLSETVVQNGHKGKVAISGGIPSAFSSEQNTHSHTLLLYHHREARARQRPPVRAFDPLPKYLP